MARKELYYPHLTAGLLIRREFREILEGARSWGLHVEYIERKHWLESHFLMVRIVGDTVKVNYIRGLIHAFYRYYGTD